MPSALPILLALVLENWNLRVKGVRCQRVVRVERLYPLVPLKVVFVSRRGPSAIG
jgi:hypothetical protein